MLLAFYEVKSSVASVRVWQTWLEQQLILCAAGFRAPLFSWLASPFAEGPVEAQQWVLCELSLSLCLQDSSKDSLVPFEVSAVVLELLLQKDTVAYTTKIVTDLNSRG